MRLQNELVDLCTKNLINAFSSLANINPGGTISNYDGSTIIVTGLNDPSLNVVIVLNNPKDVKGLQERIENTVIRRGVPYELITFAETTDSIKPLIETLGLKNNEILTGMAMEPITEHNASNPEFLDVRQARSLEDLSIFFEVAIRGFGEYSFSQIDRDLTYSSVPIPPSNKDAAFFLGYVNNEPVSTSLSFLDGHSAGVYFVSTIKEYRKRGIGEAMTRRAVIEGEKNGYGVSVLQATSMGVGVYERMGFKRIVRYCVWKSQ